MEKEKTDQEIHREMVIKFQEAIWNTEDLRGLERKGSYDGHNDVKSRYWTTVLFKTNPSLLLPNNTRLGYGSLPDYSVVFIYDHETGSSTYVRECFDSQGKDSYKDICTFAEFFPEKRVLVAQFTNRLMLYQFKEDSFEIFAKIDSVKSFDNLDRYFKQTIQRVIFEENNLNYLTYIDSEGHISLLRFDWDKLSLEISLLPGFNVRFGGLYSLNIYESELGLLAVMGTYGRQRSEPDMSSTFFIQWDVQDTPLSLHHYKTNVYQSWTPGKVTFSSVKRKGFIKVNIFLSGRGLLSADTVPVNMKFLQEKEKKKSK
ncbi:MAG TPA: hypothetical protein VGE63_01195 [Candidatus Paceibacterota bacterium]